MTLSTLDWTLIAIYLLLSLILGIWLSKKGSKSFLDYVLSGRQLPWWLAGTSIVATTFSVDTPLYVTELVRAQGISGNWQWWCFGVGGAMGVLSIYFFAKRWRRAGVVTEVEFVELRYSGKAAAFLRGFKAIYFALIKNTLGLAALLLAMSRVLEVNLGLPGQSGTWIATGIAFFYTLFGGLWGVVLTDFFQFVLAMIGSVALAIFTIDAIGGIQALPQALASANQPNALSFFPAGEDTLSPLLFGIYLGLLWWANINADGGGMFVQRMAACRNEREARLGSLWAVFAHYSLRSWPWILTALASIVLLPKGVVSDRDAYPALVSQYLPSGWRGLMVVAFLAAFMSTISTLLNWGASVLTHDFYKRFLAREKTDKHYLYITQFFILLLLLLPLPLIDENTKLRDIIETILGLGAGFGPVLIARWIWWRTNAWSEVSAILASAFSTAMFLLIPETAIWLAQFFGGSSTDALIVTRLLGTTVFSALIWIPVTLSTAPINREILLRFCEKLEPVGFWKPVGSKSISPWLPELKTWLLGIVFIYSSLFGIGKLCFMNWTEASIYLAMTAISGFFLYKSKN